MSFIHDPDIAQQVVLAGVKKADELGLNMAVAMVDGSGNLVAFARTKHARLAAVESVPAKARTAVWFGRPTEQTVEAAEKRPVVYTSILSTSVNKLVLSMGGELLIHNGEIVGAIGSAGASGAEDIVVSKVCVELWEKLIESAAN